MDYQPQKSDQEVCSSLHLSFAFEILQRERNKMVSAVRERKRKSEKEGEGGKKEEKKSPLCLITGKIYNHGYRSRERS